MKETTATTAAASDEVAARARSGPAPDPNEIADGPDVVSEGVLARARSLSIDRLEAELVGLSGLLRRRTADLLVLIGEFDARGAWVRVGALSTAAWLADVADVDIGTARSQVRVARAMREHPGLGEAVVDGRVSYAKARVIVPYLQDHNVADLLGLAGRYSARDLGAAIAAWSRRFEPDEDRDRRHRRERRLSWHTDGDGMVCFIARLPPAEAGEVIAVLDHRVIAGAPAGAPANRSVPTPGKTSSESDGEICEGGDPGTDPAAGTRNGGEDRSSGAPAGASLAQQRADTLVDLITSRETPPGGARTGYGAGSGVTAEMVIHLRGDLNTLVDGTPVPDHAVAALLPEAFVSLLVHDMNRRPIDASPRRRSPTRRQRRVVDERHPTCAHPGCDARAFLQYDHIQPHATGGPTTIDNLQRLCGPHNRARNRVR